MGATTKLTARLGESGIILAPGIYDALTALIATRAGFDTLYVSGAGIAYTRLGRPDIGLVGLSEVADTVTLIRDRVGANLIVDADTGYGNALNVARTVRLLERAGANALQIEDQTFPKRCGHLADKALVPRAEMVGKIKAAVDARASQETLVIARTDAIAVEGLCPALERSAAYAEAGADILFVEAPRSGSEIEEIPRRLGSLKPLMANMVEGGTTPIRPAQELQALGYMLVIFPGGIVRALTKTAGEFYAALARDGTTDAYRGRMLDFDVLAELVGTSALLDAGRRYEGEKS